MVKKIIRIITGANWGDEGKGLTANFFSDPNTLVVLSTNSCQRGHTVVYNGKRHVFRHFGSGTLKGAATYLTDDFMVNPAMFREEYEKLLEMGVYPKVYCRSGCLIVTPYDMLSNQIIEDSRGDRRHSSCGCGAWETRVRKMALTADGIGSDALLIQNRGYEESALDAVERYYLKKYADNDDMRSFCNDITKDNIRYDLDFFRAHVTMIESDEREKELLRGADNIIFENSQGLMLDTDYFPDTDHTTPAHIGCRYPAAIIARTFSPDEADIEPLYITRTYFTRHGNGAMGVLGECGKDAIDPFMKDMTNVPNPWQGTLRYGLITKTDAQDMIGRICKDTGYLLDAGFEAKPSVVVTHINEFVSGALDDALAGAAGTGRLGRIYTSDNEETITSADMFIKGM